MNLRCLLAALWLLTGNLATGTASAEQPYDSALKNGRTLVERKDYHAALDQYSSIQEYLKKDPGLLIEWARVYTYANMHPDAIRLFEEVRTKYPDRYNEVARELADQYKWNGDRLSYEDRLEDAIHMYRKALNDRPGDPDILNSIARDYVWQGFHRQGIAEYRTILLDHPENLDALEGLAFALHWDGQDIPAAQTLDTLLRLNPQRQEAQKLIEQIKNTRLPSVETSGYFFTDSNDQTVVSETLDAGMHLDYTTSLRVIQEYQQLRKKGSRNPLITGYRTGVGMSKDLSEKYTLDAFLYKSDLNKCSFNPWTTNTWLTWKPNDLWRVYLAYDRETFQDNDALNRHILTQSPSLSADFRPNRYWFFSLKYKRSYFTDHNRQNQLSPTIEYRLWHKPFIKLYYNGYFSNWGEADLNNGYFNPISVRSHTLGIYSGRNITRNLFAEAQASGGYEFQKKADQSHPRSSHPTCFAAAGIKYRISENWQISARGEFFTTWPDRGQRSYSNRKAFLSILYNFGTQMEGGKSTDQPSRTTLH